MGQAEESSDLRFICIAHLDDFPGLHEGEHGWITFKFKVFLSRVFSQAHPVEEGKPSVISSILNLRHSEKEVEVVS